MSAKDVFKPAEAIFYTLRECPPALPVRDRHPPNTHAAGPDPRRVPEVGPEHG